jgi:serine/threonine protein kinase
MKKQGADPELIWLDEKGHVTLMELGDHGDLEWYIQQNDLSTRDRQAIFFQVMMAVHVAKEELGARFYDLKPCNFVVQTAASDSGIMTFDVNNQTFTLAMDKPVFAKVIDFDRTDIADDRGSSADEPNVTAWHFGTLEYIPTNYLTESKPKQGHEHDLTSLGLTFLALVTDDAWTLDAVVCDDPVGARVGDNPHLRLNCPQSLQDELMAVYGAENSGFSALDKLILEFGSSHEELTGFLYRRLVFFGIDQESTKEGLVWEAIDRVLVKGEGQYQADKRRFDDDRARFSLEEGSDEKLQTLRALLEEFPGGTELLKKLCSVDPKKRGTVADVFEVEFLQSFRDPHEER